MIRLIKEFVEAFFLFLHVQLSNYTITMDTSVISMLHEQLLLTRDTHHVVLLLLVLLISPTLHVLAPKLKIKELPLDGRKQWKFRPSHKMQRI